MILPKPTQEREISLLMHYLDDVFPLQFPFYHTYTRGKREWLLAVLTSTRAVYYSTLGLSLLHKEQSSGSVQPGLVATWQEERARYYILALKEARHPLRELSPVSNVETVKGSIHTLASILHLISYEVVLLFLGDSQPCLHRDPDC